MSDYSAFVSADSEGNLTFDGSGAASAAGDDAMSYLESRAGSESADYSALSGQIVGAATAVATAALVASGTSLATAAAVAAPVTIIAAAAFAVAYGAVYALSGGHAAAAGAGYVCDANGNITQASSAAQWNALCPTSKNSLAGMGISPVYYDVPNPQAAHQNDAPTVGNGPKPTWLPTSFEAFADACLIADYQAGMTLPNFCAGKAYNFLRWPAVLALALAAWNGSHDAQGAPQRATSQGPYIPNSGGTRTLRVTAQPMGSFGGNALPGTKPSATDSISMALWLSQFKPGEDTSVGKLAAGQSIALEVNNGATIVIAPATEDSALEALWSLAASSPFPSPATPSATYASFYGSPILAAAAYAKANGLPPPPAPTAPVNPLLALWTSVVTWIRTH
jgi:hypothetical protein